MVGKPNLIGTMSCQGIPEIACETSTHLSVISLCAGRIDDECPPAW
jgi:hypothetical protein